HTIKLVRSSLLTISAMLAIGFTTRYSGLDATLGLAFARTGWLYPFFGTLLGWLGVALTGSDTSSNVLFGSLQRITAEQLGLSPTLMAAANSTGGVMGKMIDAQSIVVASTATRWYGHEGEILRYVFLHSLALACLMGLLVTLQAYVWPFTALVVRGDLALDSGHLVVRDGFERKARPSVADFQGRPPAGHEQAQRAAAHVRRQTHTHAHGTDRKQLVHWTAPPALVREVHEVEHEAPGLAVEVAVDPPRTLDGKRDVVPG